MSKSLEEKIIKEFTKKYESFELGEPVNIKQYRLLKSFIKKTLAQYKREIREKLIGEVRKYFKEEYGVKNDIVTHKKPEHGNCCTCQTCGYYHEDCVCESNRVNKFLEKLNHTDKKEGGK
jgi:hypothetical protein